MNTPHIIRAEAWGVFVASASTPGAYWLVYVDDENHLTCTCPATVPHCRHMREAAAWWAEQDAKLPPLRSMPAAPSGAFVD